MMLSSKSTKLQPHTPAMPFLPFTPCVSTFSAGACFGAGVDIVTACDIRYSTSAATFCVKVSTNKAFSKQVWLSISSFALVCELLSLLVAWGILSIVIRRRPFLAALLPHISVLSTRICIRRKWTSPLLLMWALYSGCLALLDKVCSSYLQPLSKLTWNFASPPSQVSLPFEVCGYIGILGNLHVKTLAASSSIAVI